MELTFYEGKQERKNQVAPMIISMGHSSLDNQKKFKIQSHYIIFDPILRDVK